MQTTVILTAIGSDRPGLTLRIADAVAAAGGNWLESHLSRMGNRYVGAVLVAIAPESFGRLEAAVRAIDPAGLAVTLVPTEVTGGAPGSALELDLVGQDRPGIVREVSAVLSDLEVNILTLETEIEQMAHSGGALFHARADLLAPPGLDPDALAEALERISAEVMVEIKLETGPEATLA